MDKICSTSTWEHWALNYGNISICVVNSHYSKYPECLSPAPFSQDPWDLRILHQIERSYRALALQVTCRTAPYCGPHPSDRAVFCPKIINIPNSGVRDWMVSGIVLWIRVKWPLVREENFSFLETKMISLD